MSEFTKADAEAAGWVFTHAVEEASFSLSETQGRSQVSPGDFRAEKYVSLPGRAAKLVTEQAESEEKLVERIGLYEGFLARVGVNEPTAPLSVVEGLAAAVGSVNESLLLPEGMVQVQEGKVVQPVQTEFEAAQRLAAEAPEEAEESEAPVEPQVVEGADLAPEPTPEPEEAEKKSEEAPLASEEEPPKASDADLFASAEGGSGGLQEFVKTNVDTSPPDEGDTAQ